MATQIRPHKLTLLTLNWILPRYTPTPYLHTPHLDAFTCDQFNFLQVQGEYPPQKPLLLPPPDPALLPPNFQQPMQYVYSAMPGFPMGEMEEGYGHYQGGLFIPNMLPPDQRMMMSPHQGVSPMQTPPQQKARSHAIPIVPPQVRKWLPLFSCYISHTLLPNTCRNDVIALPNGHNLHGSASLIASVFSCNDRMMAAANQ